MGAYNFKQDLMNSVKGVQLVASFLLNHNADDLQFGSDNRWDIRFLVEDRYYTMEVKEDFLHDETGFVAIEYSSRGKDSGIRTSQADYWCYILKDQLYFVSLDKLKEELAGDYYRRVLGGDNKTSLLMLIPLHEFKRIFNRNYLGL